MPPESQVISAQTTRFYKKTLPKIWGSLLAGAFIWGCVKIYQNNASDWSFLGGVLLISAVAFYLMKTKLFVLLDEVTLSNDHLTVRNDATQESIPLAHIRDIENITDGNPSSIVITLAPPSRFGEKITFIPLSDKTTNAECKVADILRDAVEKQKDS